MHCTMDSLCDVTNITGRPCHQSPGTGSFNGPFSRLCKLCNQWPGLPRGHELLFGFMSMGHHHVEALVLGTSNGSGSGHGFLSGVAGGAAAAESYRGVGGVAVSTGSQLQGLPQRSPAHPAMPLWTPATADALTVGPLLHTTRNAISARLGRSDQRSVVSCICFLIAQRILCAPG